MIAVQGTITIISLLFGMWVSRQIAKGRLKLRYSLLWLLDRSQKVLVGTA